MDGVNAREKEKTTVQNLLNLTGVKGAGSHSEWFANARVRVLHNPTHLCVDRLHNVNLLLYNMFNLKAPLFKQGVFILQNCDRQNVFTINVWAGF